MKLTDKQTELMERLLDPILTLDEAALLLGVSKATIRRYTNSGKLKCFRTPGGYRRFRLSEIMEVLDPRLRDEH